MADAKTTALTEDTSPSSTDISHHVKDPGGTPLDRKVTHANTIQKAHGLSDGALYIISSVMVRIKHNFAATTAPTATNDSSENYALGSLWIDVTNDKSYICVDSTATAAVWNDLTASAAGGGDLLAANNLSDVASAATSRTNLGVAIGSDVQAHSSVLDATTASFTTADETKLDGIETAADVTDTANVTAAGAVMDSELTSIADVKALDQSVVSGAAPTLATTNMTEGTNKNFVTDAEATVIGNTSGTNTGDESAASDSAAGVVELATAAETTTGTDTARAVTPDGLAGSEFGERAVQITCFAPTTDVATGDGAAYFHVDSRLAGMNLVDVHAEVITAGVTGTTDVQIHNLTQTADMLSTKITIDTGETGSDTAAAAAVIDTANDDVAENDLLRIDVDAVSSGTAPQGLIITLGFRLP